MKKLYALVLINCLSLNMLAQQESLRVLVDQGIELHDKGDYEGAIKKYDEVIAIDKDHYLAYFEKSFSLYNAQKYEECIALCKQLIKKFKDNKQLSQVYVNYGSSLDGLNKPKDAIKIYNEGIKRFPDAHLLHFNKAITEYTHNNIEEAFNGFKRSVFIKPLYSSSHQYLGYIMSDKNKIASAMALSTFLMFEPQGKRAEKNLPVLLKLFGSNVSKKDDKNITISLNSSLLDTDTKKEDNFQQAELLMSLRSALDYDDKFKDLTATQKLQDKMDIICSIGSEGDGFFTSFYVPFFNRLKSDSQLEVFTHIIYASATDDTNKKWLEENTDKTKEFYQWLKAYQWP